MSRPKISAPFNPVHLTASNYSSPDSQSHDQQHQHHPSDHSLSLRPSPYLRPISPSSPTYSSHHPARNFSRPTTPQSPRTPTSNPSSSPRTSPRLHPRRPRGKSNFREEDLDVLSPTTGSAIVPHTLFSSAAELGAKDGGRPGSSTSMSSHFLAPPSPTPHAQRPPTPTSPTYTLRDRDAEKDGGMVSPVPPSPGLQGRAYGQQGHREQQEQGQGLVAGERKRSMWERVLRRGSEGEDGFPVL